MIVIFLRNWDFNSAKGLGISIILISKTTVEAITNKWDIAICKLL